MYVNTWKKICNDHTRTRAALAGEPTVFAGCGQRGLGFSCKSLISSFLSLFFNKMSVFVNCIIKHYFKKSKLLTRYLAYDPILVKV